MKDFLSFPTIIRIGLALVFLSHAIKAFIEPDEFVELLGGSFVGSLVPLANAAFVLFIAISDAIVAALLLTGWKTYWVSVYATLWIAGVLLVMGPTLEALEHAAFLAMSLSLVARGRSL